MAAETSDIVRVGTVTAVDGQKMAVRVKFKDAGITSGWLPVLQHIGGQVDVQDAGRHTHEAKDSVDGDCTVEKDGAHTHAATLTYWLPKVNDTVIALYVPMFNGDGFILGGLNV